MAKRPINIIGPSYRDPNLHWSRQDTVNWLPVRAEAPGTLTEWQLRDAPGVKPFVRITRTVPDGEGTAVIDVGPIRGMRNVEGKLFVVAAQTLYQISNTGVAIPFGTIPGVGRVSMAHNQFGLANQIIIVNGSAGYVFNTNTQVLVKITDEGYPGAFIADYIDQYLAQVEPQGRFWFHSDLANGTDYNTLDRYEAEADPDRIVSLLVSHREVLVFGRDTIEPFVNTGGQTGTFERASNTVIEVGCAAKFTPRKLDNSVFWLDDKRLVRRLDGYTPIRVSTDAIDAAFSECTATQVAAAYAFTWETRGHKVYYITVPGMFTFGYDVLTGQWHRRSTWNMAHWDAVDAVFWNGQWIIGSGQNGRLYILDQNYKLDRCDPLVRKRVTGKLWDAENEMTLNNVELKFNTGGPVSVCVPFPDQPTGPTLSGEAPNAPAGVAYSFGYTPTPGGAPIDRTVLRPGSYIVVGGEIKPIPNDGWSWNQSTATISNAAPSVTSVVLKLRTYDANGLFADHEDSFEVVEAYEILVTGSSPSVGQPCMCTFINTDISDITAIPLANGADIQGAVAAHDGDGWCAVSGSGARYAPTLADNWTSGTAINVAYAAVIPDGDGGWIATNSGDIYGAPAAGNFSSITMTATDPTKQSALDSSHNVIRIEELYRTLTESYHFTCDDPYTDTWDLIYTWGIGSEGGRSPSGMVFVGDRLYMCGLIRGSTVYGVGFSEDGGVTWPLENVVFETTLTQDPPIRIWEFDGVLVTFCRGKVLRCSNNDWATIPVPIDVISTGGNPSLLAVGSRIAKVGSLLYILGSGTDGNKIVTFNPMTLEFSEPTVLPIIQGTGIAARKLT